MSISIYLNQSFLGLTEVAVVKLVPTQKADGFNFIVYADSVVITLPSGNYYVVILLKHKLRNFTSCHCVFSTVTRCFQDINCDGSYTEFVSPKECCLGNGFYFLSGDCKECIGKAMSYCS